MLPEVLITQKPLITLRNDFVRKYEFNGISLRRINKTHNLNEVTESNPFDTDFYKIKIDMSENGIDRSVNTGLEKVSSRKQPLVVVQT